MLQSPHLEDRMKNIGNEQSLLNRSYFEHICLNNIKYIYQHSDKCDEQQNLKDAIDATMVSTPDKVTEDSHSLSMTQPTVKNKC